MRKCKQRGVPFTLYGFIVLILIGCGSYAHVSVVRTQSQMASPIKTIALMPGGGVLADAIGTELLRYGFNIIDTEKISSLMVRENLNEIELINPQNLAQLRADGIDAVIFVKSVAGYDKRPQSANIKIVHTANGQLVAGANWQNGQRGAQGSPADQHIRVDLAIAARDIAEALGHALQDSTNKQ
jgi:hypothetical protein